jgi:hypothetical protein
MMEKNVTTKDVIALLERFKKETLGLYDYREDMKVHAGEVYVELEVGDKPKEITNEDLHEFIENQDMTSMEDACYIAGGIAVLDQIIRELRIMEDETLAKRMKKEQK